MVVRKIIERILEVGQTSVTITDTDIPGSLVRTYSNDPDLMPVQIVLTGSTLKIDYEAQTTDKYVAVELVKQGLDIIDNLTSTDTDAALSAKQGKVLKDLVDYITPIRNLSELDDVSAEDPQTGDILKYNGTSEKWEKYNLPDIPSYLEQLGDVVINSASSGQVLTFNGAYWTNEEPSGSINYSTTEQVIGTWINNKPLYKKSFSLDPAVNLPYNTWTDSGVDIPNGICVDCECVLYQVDGNTLAVDANIGTDGSLYLLNVRNNPMDVNTITVIYTKTTD